MRLLILVIALCAGCAGQGAIDLSIDATGTVAGIDHFHVLVTNNGAQSQPADLALPDAPVTIPFPLNIQLRFPKDRSGPVSIHIDAVDRAGAILASGDTTAMLSAGADTQAMLVLRGRGSSVDAGMGTVRGDAAVPIDMAPPPLSLAAPMNYGAGKGPRGYRRRRLQRRRQTRRGDRRRHHTRLGGHSSRTGSSSSSSAMGMAH